MAERLLNVPQEPAWLLEDLVKTKIQSLSFVATLAVVFGMISWGSALAQTTPSTPTDQPTPQTQPAPTPDTPPSQQTPQSQPAPTPEAPPAAQQPPSSQSPDQAPTPSSKDSSPAAGASAAGTGASSDSQTFSGTVEKSGDKYVLKDDSGKTYDIDHQDDVKKFEGKRVRVQGKLDDSGTKIMVK
jgi:outer membrane biosynthesis protein TonB